MGAQAADLEDLDRDALEVDGARRAGEVHHGVDVPGHPDVVADVVLDEREALRAEQLLDVGDRAGDQVVDRHDVVTSIEQCTTEVRSQEACSARDDHSCHGGDRTGYGAIGVACGERRRVGDRVDSEHGAIPLHELRRPHPGVPRSRPPVTRGRAPRGDHRRPDGPAGAILRVRRHRGDARTRAGGAAVVRRDRAGHRARRSPAICLHTIGGGASSATSDEYLRAFHDPEYPVRPRAFVGRIMAAVVTLGFGGRWASKVRRCTAARRSAP